MESTAANEALKAKLSDLMKTSMKSGDKDTLAFCRNLHAVIRKKEIDEKISVDDSQFIKIVTTSLKQRQDSLESFQAAKREDLIEKELKEIQFLKAFLPAQLSLQEIEQMVRGEIAAVGAKSIKDLGKVMGAIQGKIQGRADGKTVSQTVKSILESMG